MHLSRPLPAWEYRDYLGWMEQGDGKLAYGIFVQNGRLKGAALVCQNQKLCSERHLCSLIYVRASVCAHDEAVLLRKVA